MREDELDRKGKEEVEALILMINEISGISEFGNVFRREFCNLSRRVKLLLPLMEEMREIKEEELLQEEIRIGLVKMKEGVESARELLKFGNEGSRIYLVLERGEIAKRFQDVTNKLQHALSCISYDKLDISDEVKEQVDLVHSQLKRANGRFNFYDEQLDDDLLVILDQSDCVDVDSFIIERLAQKLQLFTVWDLKRESMALHDMIISSSGDPGASLEKMSSLLRKTKEFVQTRNSESSSAEEQNFSSEGHASPSPIVPDDFRCPISLELMRDPVIVATGQTYERSCIQKWLNAGHGTCPKSQQMLTNTVLTPNYVLRSLITQWCEANGVEPPKRPCAWVSADRSAIDELVWKLSSLDSDDQQAAAGELRLLTKRNADNRICIAEAGAITLLVELLASSDPRTQEHAVTTLLNLSICEKNKGLIMATEGALRGIVEVLQLGSMESRENAAATIFSLSIVERNKEVIGTSAGCIPALVDLLREGTQRGKKDAATALFNLCMNLENKKRAVRTGVIVTLMGMVADQRGDMLDEALAIIGILIGHEEGKEAVATLDGAVPVLVEVIANGTSRNKENAVAVLLAICKKDDGLHLVEAREMGAIDPLLELAHNGTSRSKRKANALVNLITQV